MPPHPALDRTSATDRNAQILEGIATVIIGIISFWVVVDFPDDAQFLSDKDRARVLKRLRDDQQSSAGHEDFKMSYMWDSLRDWKTWVGMLMYMGVDGSSVHSPPLSS